jgi:hypothetical protein
MRVVKVINEACAYPGEPEHWHAGEFTPGYKRALIARISEPMAVLFSLEIVFAADQGIIAPRSCHKSIRTRVDQIR